MTSDNERPKRLDKEIQRGDPVTIFFDGKPVQSYKGETIAAALMASGILISRTVEDRPLGIYCNIGVCHSCLMKVNGVNGVRICKTPVSEGCQVETQHLKRDR